MEEERYTDQSVGENEYMEREAIMHFFPMGNIEKVTDKELQYKGVDYIVSFGTRKAYIDCKVHHYNSDYFVYECFDTRPSYKNYGWTNTDVEHLTTYIIYIVPALKKAYLYSYHNIIEFQKDSAFEVADYTEVKHTNGSTFVKVFKSDFIERKECIITVPQEVVIKKNVIKPNSVDPLTVALKIHKREI